MNENIKLFFSELSKKYGTEVSLFAPDADSENLTLIPVALRALYQFTSKAKLPFGEIFDIEAALMQSARKPFTPDWFVFGKDNYFSFWLCSFNVDEEGLSFTCWDHESGNEIDGAVWSDVVSFLKEKAEENED